MVSFLVEAPCFSRGKLDFSPAEEWPILKWALAPGFAIPALKRRIRAHRFPGALKRSFPRINAGASTQKPNPLSRKLRAGEAVPLHERLVR